MLKRWERAGLHKRLATLARLVDAANDLPQEQWHSLYERAAASGADLLLEVGRGYGNSTVCLTEAAHKTGARVVSVGNDEPPAFEGITWPKLQPVVGGGWRQSLTVVQGDVRDFALPACGVPCCSGMRMVPRSPRRCLVG